MWVYTPNTAYNTDFLTYIANEAKSYNKNVYFVGECWDNINVINNYYKSTIRFIRDK